VRKRRRKDLWRREYGHIWCRGRGNTCCGRRVCIPRKVQCISSLMLGANTKRAICIEFSKDNINYLGRGHDFIDILLAQSSRKKRQVL
jgi:hypothetical protein